MKDNLNLIDSYFNGELSASEQADFDKRLNEDLEFQSDFQEIKLIREVVVRNSRSEMLEFLQDKEASIQNKEVNKTHTTMKKYISIAAGLLLVVSITYLTIFNGSGQIDGEKVFESYYHTYPNIAQGAERGAAVDLTNLKSQAYYAYDLSNFAQAESSFEKLVEVEKSADNYFYLGLSNIETGTLESAVKNLNTVINNFREYTEQAQWFLALTLLKDNKNDEAISNLVDLAVNGDSYKEESLRILREVFDFTLDSGVVLKVRVESCDPEDDESLNNPDGASFIGKRKYQMGELLDENSGLVYLYFNDRPIDGLKRGDIVECVIIRKASKNNKGFAFILG